MKKLYSVIFSHIISSSSYLNEKTNLYYTNLYGVSGYDMPKQLFFEKLEDLYEFLYQFSIKMHSDWYTLEELSKRRDDLKIKIEKNLASQSCVDAGFYYCKVALIIIPDVKDIMASPILK